MRHLLLISLLALALPASAATVYYIDYNAANDSANGTSTSTPFKRHPYMVGFTGSYVHAAGDSFIFKGGVTWPRAVLPLVPLAGGSSASVRDYYGVDFAYFTGGSWSRPVFDFENSNIGTFTGGAGVQLNVNYLTFDNLELKRHRSVLEDGSSKQYGCSTICIINAADFINILNCLIYDWDLPSLPAANEDRAGWGGILYAGGGTGGNFMISNCVFHSNGTARKGGYAIYGVGNRICYNTATNVSGAYVGGGIIHNNYFHHLVPADDPVGNHGNGILTQNGTSTIFSNVLHDLSGYHTAIYVDTFLDGLTTGTNLIYGNTMWNLVQVGIQTGVGLGVGLRAFNNTIVGDGAACVRLTDSGSSGTGIGLMELRNNWFITSLTGAGVVTIDTSVTTLIANHNITNTVAVASGYGALAGTRFQPTSVSSPTIDTGTNLLSYFTRSLPFDIGAEEYFSGSRPIVSLSGRMTLSGSITIR